MANKKPVAKKKQGNQSANRAAPGSAKSTGPDENLIAESEALAEKANTVAVAEGITVDPAAPDGQLTAETLRQAVAAALQSEASFERAADLHNRRRQDAEQATERLKADRRTLDADRDKLKKDTAKLKEDLAKLGTSQQDLEDRERKVEAREFAADSGFRQQSERVAAQRQAELDRINKEIASAWEKFADTQRADRERMLADVNDERSARLAELDTRERELASERDRVAAQRSEQRAEQGRLAIERENIEDEKRRLTARVEAAAGQQIGELRQRLTTAEELLAAAGQEADRCRQQLVAQQDDIASFGGLSLPETAHRLRQLEADNVTLRRSLAERPSTEVTRQLAELSEAHRDCEEERHALLYQVSRLESEVRASAIGVAELEHIRDSASSYRAIVEGYRVTIRELEERFGQLTQERTRATAFPGCAKLDEDLRTRISPRLSADTPDLTALVHQARSLIAHADQPLMYSERDVRSFLAGLAASHLHILEGISGTGKTSLPRAFAAAIGAGHELVEVQAGWRDRNDLFGSYNTFERLFHESKFLRALYMAQCPAYAGRPFFLVLDEMNLSHPEHYFADLLSKLQNPDGKPIELLPAPVGDPPEKLLGGTGILLPPNVWFIGTANNDETTLTFADKTYDRAYVLELPTTPPDDKPDPHPAMTPLSVHALQTAFDTAAEEQATAGERALAFLDGPLRGELQRLCRIGWGPRMARQIQRYTAVVCAAGGKVEEATDHVLATKILRKVKGRYEIRKDDLTSIEATVRRCWAEFGFEGEPAAALTVLADELRQR